VVVRFKFKFKLRRHKGRDDLCSCHRYVRLNPQVHNCFPPGRGQGLLLNPTHFIVDNSPVFQRDVVLTLREDERLQVVELPVRQP